MRCVLASSILLLHELDRLFAAQRLRVVVQPHDFDEACGAVRPSEIHDANSLAAVAASFILSLMRPLGVFSRSRSRPQHFSVLAALANGHERALQFELRKVQHTLSRGWPRNLCNINYGREPWVVPTELATLATFLRITPLVDCPPALIARGFTTQHPPPVPSELVCFRAEWQVQNALEAMRLPHKGFLSAAAWERDISYFFDTATYQWYDQHLHKLLLASEPPAEARVERVNLLVKQAARMEMFEMGEDPERTTERGCNLVEDIMLGWQRVIHLLAERFAVSRRQIRFCLSAHPG